MAKHILQILLGPSHDAIKNQNLVTNCHEKNKDSHMPYINFKLNLEKKDNPIIELIKLYFFPNNQYIGTLYI
jgi:hypothetical protein